MSLRLGNCNACQGAYPCLGTVTLTSVASHQQLTFSGVTAAGAYAIQLCTQDAWCYNIASGPAGYWVITKALTCASNQGRNFIVATYNGVSGAASADFNDPMPSGYGYATEAAASANAGCASAFFTSAGGYINVDFLDWFYPDDALGASSLVFSLYQITPNFSVSGASFTWVDSTHLTGYFTVVNNTRGEIDGVTFAVSATGGITAATSTGGPYNFAPGASQNVTFNLTVGTAGNANNTATLTPTFVGSALPSIVVDLAPIIIWVAGGTLNGPWGSVWTDNATFQNVGYTQTYNLVTNLNLTGNIISLNDYTSLSPISGTVIPPGSGGAPPARLSPAAEGACFYGFTAASGATSVTPTFQFVDGSITFPAITVPSIAI